MKSTPEAASEARASQQVATWMTLIEVIVAMTIFTLALVAIGRLVDLGSESAQETRLQSTGTRLAQAKMAEVEAGVISVQSGSGDGTFDTDPGWTWNLSTLQQATPNLYLVTVKVSRQQNGAPMDVSLSQFVYDPSLLGSSAQAEAVQSTPSTTTTVANPATSGGTSP